uniref:Uncharacterized protein n=1 Tax=Globisporangium ultimum (strain ATCC 200006 / CBS 805.95 / DAOM BR144) TaxID=431595 RepID=K3WKJ2_GLOUD
MERGDEARSHDDAGHHEEDDRQRAPSPKTAADAAAPKDASKPKYRTIGLDDEPDQLQYRSMAKTIAATGPPAFGRSLMHEGLGGMPMAFASGVKKMGGAPAFTTGIKKSEAAPSFGVRVDRTKYVGVAPRDLPPPPFRLEMHTHFHAKLEAIQRVCSVVGRKLCELDTDFEFKSEKCKWKVEYRRNGGAQRVQLNILIFKTNKEYVVEVQRREGDITALMHLYGELKTFFKRNQLLVEKTQPGAGVKRPAPKTTVPKTALTTENLRDGVLAIKGLLESKYVDTQIQGVLGAISLSAQDEANARPEMAVLIPHLVALGQSKNSNVARLVGVALSRLCDHPECRQAFVASKGWQFIVDCAAGGPDVNPEVQRESLHVVESLCPLYHDELAKAANASKVLQLVQEWQSIEDPRLKKHACNAYRALKDAGVIA